MKNLNRTAFILFSAFLLITVACNSKSTKSVKTEESPLFRIEVSINGMTCTDCEDIIQTNVAKLDGIKTIKALYTTGKATIEYYPGIVDTAKIRKAINKTGYSVEAFQPLPLDDSIR